MSDAHLGHILRHLCRLAGAPASAAWSDNRLLQRFAADRDEAAFAALLERHGPMVLGVCRRVLGHEHDAEDAFQATFLVLARKAGSIRAGGSVGGWLYEVAHHIAVRARSDATRRRTRESQVVSMPCAAANDEAARRELRTVLDEELARLPEGYRLPLVLCYLEGKTNAEAARELGWPVGSMSKRLARGRELLRGRLARRGVTLAAAAVAAVLAENATAAVPGALGQAALRLVLLVSAGQAVASAAPGPVAALADGVVREILLARVRAAVAVLLVMALLGTGVGVLAHQAPAHRAAESGKDDPAERPQEGAAPRRNDSHGDALPEGAVARLGTLRFRHEGEAGSVAFSPDGKTLAATNGEKGGDAIFLWDAATGKPLTRLQTRASRSLAFSPDGKLLAWLEAQEVHLWDRAASKEVRRLPAVPPKEGLEGTTLLRFAPDGKALAWGGSGPVVVWDLVSDKQLVTVGETRSYAADLAFSPDSKALAVATQEPSVQLWDLATGKLVRGIDAHNNRVQGEDERTRFAMAVAFSPDGKTVASAGRERIVISEAATGKELVAWAKTREWVLGLAFTPDGQTLVAAGENAKVRIYDAATGKERFVLNGDWIGRSMALSPDGKTVVLGTAYSTLCLWDVTTGQKLFAEAEAHDAPVHAVAFSPDGRLVATGGENQHIHLWDAATGRHVRRLKGQSAGSVSFSPDGKRLATLWMNNKTARVWDVADGEELFQLAHPGADEAPAVAFTPDGNTLVSLEWKRPTAKEDRKSAGTARLHVWDAAGGRHLREVLLPEMRPSCLAVAPGGRLAAVGGFPSALWLCELERDKEVLPLSGHGHTLEALAFSPDGRMLVTGSQDRTVRLWETATGKEILSLSGHERPLKAVAFAPGGRVVASADGDFFRDHPPPPQCIRLWDVVTGKELSRLEGHDSDVTALAFSPDGTRLVSGQRNSTVLVWDVTAVLRALPRRAKALGREELESLWADLASADARTAHQAVWTLAAAPAQTVPFLKENLRPAAEVDPDRVRRRIADLDSDQFAVRVAARKELEEAADQAEPELRKALEANPSLEARKQLERLLAGPRVARSVSSLRTWRALQALEHIGSDDARELLRALGKGSPRAWLTQEAGASLQRLTKPAANTP
jgi:RNA polymerase sigma factor (sigma-70 family)